MKTKQLLFILLQTVGLVAVAQTPTVNWQKTYGGSLIDMMRSIHPTPDGGYFLSGISQSNNGDFSGGHGDFDYWIHKINSEGEIDWIRAYGGSGDDGYVSGTGIPTTDGGFIFCSSTYSNDGDVEENHGMIDFWLVKTDNSGEIEWEKTYGGSDVDIPYKILSTADNGYFIAGYSVSMDGDVSGNHGFGDGWVIKVDSSGDLEWSKCLGGTNQDAIFSASTTADGGYVLAGYSDSNDGDASGHHGTAGDFIQDFWVVKISPDGNIEWQNSFGGSSYDQAYSVIQSNDDGYLVSGYTRSIDGDVTENKGETDSWIIKLNNAGNLVWQKSIGGSFFDNANTAKQTEDGGFLIVNHSDSSDGDVSENFGNMDIWLVKLSGSGELIWEDNYGGSEIESCNLLEIMDDGSYIIGASSRSSDGDLTTNFGLFDYWVLILNNEDLATVDNQFSEIQIFPNPVENQLHFSENLNNLEVFSISGQKILKRADETKLIDVSNLRSGVYILKAETKDGNQIVEKFIKN